MVKLLFLTDLLSMRDVSIEHTFKSEKKYIQLIMQPHYINSEIKKKNNIKSIKYSKFKLKKNLKKIRKFMAILYSGHW